MKKLAPIVISSVLASVSVFAPSVSAQTLNHAQVYEPSISGLGCIDAGPSEEFCFLLSGTGPEFLDAEILEFDSPYPLEYRQEEYSPVVNFRHGINVKLRPEKIYPAKFYVPTKVRVLYTDGSSEVVTGNFPISPLVSLVSGTPIQPTSSPKTTPTVTKTVTVTPAPKTVTETATVTEKVQTPGDAVTVTATPAPKTVTETATVTEKVQTPGDAVTVTATPAPKTVTETATVTEKVQAPGSVVTTTVSKAAAPVTVTNTVKVDESGSSTGSIVALVIGLLALLGGIGAAVMGNQQILNALPI